MSRQMTAALIGALALMTAPHLSARAGAADWNAPPAQLGLDTTDSTKWLSSENRSDLYLGAAGFSQGTRSDTSVKLGQGWSAGFFSSLYNAPGSAPGSASDAHANWGGGAVGLLPGTVNPGFNSGSYSGLNPVAGNALTSTFGGHVSKDLGGGVSVNFAGGVTRDPLGISAGGITTEGFYPGPRNAWNMNGSGDVSASVGGGMSVDFGGSSLSIGATMTKSSGNGFSSGRCAGQPISLCR